MARRLNHPIVRGIVIAVAVIVLLPVGYVGSVMGLCFALNASALPKSVAMWPVTLAYVRPLDWYMHDTDRPGSHTCHVLIDSANKAGRWISQP